MEEFTRKLGWQKMAALMIIFSVVFLGIVIVTSITPSKSDNASSIIPTPTPVGSALSKTSPTHSTQKPAPTSDVWKVYGGPSFSIAYPPSYTELSGTLPSNGGNASVFTSSDGGIKVYVDAYTTATVTERQLIKVFNGLNYAQDATQIVGASAVRFMGAVFIKKQAHQDVAIIFTARGILFKIQLSYIAPQRDPIVEQIFYQMLSTFQAGSLH